MDSIEIYLPCEVFPVQARFGLSDSLSTLEMLLLRAIHLGQHHIEGLGKVFGLTEKMRRDVLMGLWHAGHLVFIPSDKKVYLSNRASKLIDEGNLEQLERAVSGFEEMNLMFDLVTGRVLPVAGRTSPPRAAQIIPYTTNAIKLEHLPYDAIVAALERESSRRNIGLRVLNAAIAFNRTPNGQRMRWRKLEVACYRNTSGNHEVTVLNTGALPFGARRDVGEYLSREIDQEHEGTDKHFFERLRNNAMQGRSTRAGLEIEIDRLEKAAQNLTSCPLDKIAEQHEQITELAKGVALAVAEEVSSVARLTPIIGREGHERLIDDLLNRAKKQIVIACPFVSGDGLASLRSRFKQAMNNGARIIVLWGIQRRQEDGKEPYDALDQDVKNIVEDFRTLFPGKFFFSQRATGTHAKVFICDNSALVTSLNILRPSHENVTEIGVLAQHLDGDNESQQLPIVADLLTWAREIVPDSLVANAIIVGQKQLIRVPSPPVVPLVHFEDHEQQRSEVAVWASQWLLFVDQLRNLRGVRPTVRLVRDGQHRGLLDLAIRSAKNRLIVTSDQVSSEAVRPSTRESLLKLGNQKVVVRLVYRSPSRQKIAEGAAAEELLTQAQESARIEGYDIQSLKTTNHSKVLVFDDTAVISSFNFLSHSGQYAADRASKVTELGLLLTGPGVADNVVRTLARAIPLMRAVPTGGLETAPIIATERDQAILEIIKALDSENTESLKEIFITLREPWGVLESISKLSTIAPNPKLVRRLSAACMAANGSESNPIEYERWARFLAREAWQGGDPVQCYVLIASVVEHLREDLDLPHFAVIQAAVNRGTGSHDIDWGMLDLNGIPRGQRIALAITAMREAIENGSRDAAEFAELMSDDLPDAWNHFLLVVLDYLKVSFERFPHQSFTHSASQPQQEFQFEKEFKALQNVLEHNSKKQLGLKSGSRIWTHFFGPSGKFFKLLEAVRRRDSVGVHEWFDLLETSNPSEILREGIHEVLGADEEKLGKDKRDSLENSLRNIMEAAVAVERVSERTRYDHSEQVVTSAKQLCAELKKEWLNLLEEAEKTIDPLARPLTDPILHEFATLANYSL